MDLQKAYDNLKVQFQLARDRKNAATLGQYQSDILLAKALIDDGKISRALDRLDRTLANDRIPPETKGWELYRLLQTCHQAGPQWRPDVLVVKLLTDPQSNAVVAVTADGKVFRSRNVESNQLGFEPLSNMTIGGAISDAALSPDQRLLAVTLRQAGPENLQVWDLNSQQRLVAVEAHQTDARFVTFLADGQLLTGGNRNKTLQFARWQLNGNQLRLNGSFIGDFPMQTAAISSDQQRVAVGCDIQRVCTFDISNWEQSPRAEYFGDPLKSNASENAQLEFRSVCFDPANAQNTAVICGMSNGEVVRVKTDAPGKAEVLCQHRDPITAIAALNGARPLIFSASEDETIKVFDTLNVRTEGIITGQLGKIRAVAVLPGKNEIVAADDSPMVKVWQFDQQGDEIAIETGANNDVFAAAVAANQPGASEYWLAFGDTANRLHLQSSTLKTTGDTWQAPGHLDQDRFNASCDAAGKLLVTASNDGHLYCYQTSTGQMIWQQDCNRNAQFAVSPDGSRVLYVDPANPTILLVGDPRQQQVVASIPLPREIQSLLISADGLFAAVSGKDGVATRIQVVDLQANSTLGTEIFIDDFHSWAPDVSDGFLICDTKRVGAGINERRLALFRQGKRVSFRVAFEENIVQVIRPQGQPIYLTQLFDGEKNATRIAIWNEDIWQNQGTPQKSISLNGQINSVQFDPRDGSVLITNLEGGIKKWNPADGSLSDQNQIVQAVVDDWFNHQRLFDDRSRRYLDDPRSTVRMLVRSALPTRDGVLVTGDGNALLLDSNASPVCRILPTPVVDKIQVSGTSAGVARFADGRMWVVPIAQDGSAPRFASGQAQQLPGFYEDFALDGTGRCLLINEAGQLQALAMESGKVSPVEGLSLDSSTVPTCVAATSIPGADGSASPQFWAVGTHSGKVLVYDASTKQLIQQLQSPSGVVESFSRINFSGNGRFLAGVGLDGSLVLWATKDWSGLVLADSAKDVPVTEFSFNNDSSRLASGRADGTVVVFLVGVGVEGFATNKDKLGSGAPQVFTFSASDIRTRNAVHVVQFSPDGKELVTSTQNDFKLIRWLTTGWDIPKPYVPDENPIDTSNEKTDGKSG